MRSIHRVASLGLLMNVAATSLAHARVEICNETARDVIITYQAPADNCDTGSRQDHMILTGGECATVGVGSAKGQSFYYFAEDQNDPDAFWAGDQGVWVPAYPGGRCTAAVSCKPSEGDVCGDGRVYGMREVIGRKHDYKLRLIE